MITYRAMTEVPPLVWAASDLAARMGFAHSCSPAVGRLLRVLAGQVRTGRIGEIGTGCGVGAAWMASALRPGVSLLTVEVDEERAAATATLLAVAPAVRVLHADWHDLLSEGPFALLFVDVAPAKQDEPERLLDALEPGGLLVFDDLTLEDQWPAGRRGKPDPVRAVWLNASRVLATELLVTPASAVVLATRVA